MPILFIFGCTYFRPVVQRFANVTRCSSQDETNRETCAPSKDVEELEQFSPVSVLDPPFEADEEDVDSNVKDREEGDRAGFDYDSSYAFVQKRKQRLLEKLRRFERLAMLDPVELEKRMLESDDEGDDDASTAEHEGVVTIRFADLRKSPDGLSKLVEDLVAEEEEGEREQNAHGNGRSAVERVKERMESWQELGPNKIDVMVGGELSAGWKPGEEQLAPLAEEIEAGMFKSLLEELAA